MRKLEGINEAITDRRGLVKRLTHLGALSLLSLLVFAPSALAQGNLESQGITLPCPSQLDRFPEGTVCGEGGAYINPETGTAAQPLPRAGSLESLGITQPCPGQLDRFPEGTVCGEGGAYLSPVTGRGAQPLGGGSGEGGTYICADFDDQGQAQEAFGRSLRAIRNSPSTPPPWTPTATASPARNYPRPPTRSMTIWRTRLGKTGRSRARTSRTRAKPRKPWAGCSGATRRPTPRTWTRTATE